VNRKYLDEHISKGLWALLEIPLDRCSDVSLYKQISYHLKRMIESGTLQVGMRLPGSRFLARTLGVSRNTVVLAYDLLEDDGYIEQRGRKGAFVTFRRKVLLDLPKPEGPMWDLASGTPSMDLIPWKELGSISREIIYAKGSLSLTPPPLAGLPELRKALVRHAASRGIPARWEDVVVTTGGKQGLFLSLMSLAEIGVQKIWVEELTYPDIFPMINKLKLQVETVPMAPADMLERCNILKEKDALYLIPSFHNPTGRTMDYETRKEVLALAKKKGFWIIEDDAYGELRYSAQSVPAMKAMENAEKVIYLGSFSQLLFPGLRNGYALVPNQLKEEFREALACSAGTVSSLVQYLVSAFLSEGLLENCLERARKEISKRMDCLISSIEKLLPHALAEKPLGGIYLWVTLPGLSDESLHALALSEDISVVPGKEFTKDKRETFSVRLSVSSLGINDLKQAVERLAKAWGDKQ